MKRTLSVILILSIVLSLFSFPVEADTVQHNYSTTANSGIRHEVCTTLEGTSADSYYAGDYTYDALSQLGSDALLPALRTLMASTHKTKSTYAQCRDLAVKTDCENADGTTISLLYCSYVATWEDYINNKGCWNREHVWPKSLGGFGETGAGADLHHIRPSDKSINSKRGNLKYGNVDSGSAAKSVAYIGSLIGGYSKGDYFEPLDNVKGDVARICLYVYVRYGGELTKCSNITNVFQSVDVLLQWCALDPVDTWEMGRNEVVGAIQGNRNVFIDYPELAWLLFGQEIPSDMTTPSGNAKTGSSNTKPTEPAPTEPAPTEPEPTEPEPTACPHRDTRIKNASSATCTVDGYTGDTYCADCGQLLASGETIGADGHRYNVWVITREPTATEDGIQQRECDLCGEIETQSIPATGQTEPPATEPPVTEPPVTGPQATEPAQTEPLYSEPSQSEPVQTLPAHTEPSATRPPVGQQPESGFLRWILIAAGLCGAAVIILVIVRKKR